MKLILTSLMLFAFLVVCRLCKSQSTSTVGDISTIKETSVLIFAHKCNKHRYTPIASKPTLLILIHCLLAQCSDIETNPGPNTSQLRYPCGQCNQEVTWRQRGILCDNCNQWFHIDCQNIGDSTYECLSDSRFVWQCLSCGQSNFSQSLATSLDSLSDSNPFAPLTSNLSLLNVSHRSQQSGILTTVDIASPIATSTPNSKVKRKHLTTVKENERITVLNINCRSIKNKIPDLHQVIQQVKPDIISCTETWLKPEVHTSEIFPIHLKLSSIPT